MPKLLTHNISRWLFILLSMPVMAQIDTNSNTNYPNHPVRMIVGFTPGSATDVAGRIFAQKFNEIWNVAVTIDNIPGAGGALGVSRAAKAPADGYTIMFTANGAVTIAPSLQPKPPYDVLRDFTPVSQVLSMPSVWAVYTGLKVNTISDLIALAKAQPATLSYGTPGNATPQHIAGELFKGIAKIDIAHVPYKGAVFTDVIAGRVPLTLQNAGAILPLIRDGRLRAIAVTSLSRSSILPEVPTVAESGFPGFEAISWFALLVPKGTSPSIVKKLHQDSLKILATNDVKTKFHQLGVDLAGSSPEELATTIKNDIDKWSKVIKDAGINNAD